ncbi:MAG: protein kinase domain-containing protein [Anaerovoracaceae bacterium]|jgi:beta-lactam-binding protein with PASTA domain
MSSKVIAGRYELLNKIGDGGMAVVYRAQDRLLNRFVAVKILKPAFIKDEKFIENFRRESHAAASLTHANIVSVYDVGQEGNINYIVMELVEGKALSQVIREEAPMDYNRVIDISKQIAAGLSAAHKHGIIHRDVKPHNILINEDGVAKITDFGIAKAVTEGTIVDNTNENVMGSVHYFSPEQARGGYVDEKSDIYSLGIVMYEMLTGKVPFDGDNPVSVALKHINEEIVPPSQLTAGIPPSLEKIVMKATSKLQTDRYDSADEVIEALDQAALVNRVVGPGAQRPVSEDPYAQEVAKYREEVKDQQKKTRRIIVIIAIAVAAAAALFAWGYFHDWFAEKARIPDLRGMTYSQAKKAASVDGFKLKKGEMVYNKKYEAGEITSQSPTPGTEAEDGTVIIVNICKGEEEGTVPKLVGLDKEKAVELIKELGFEVGPITERTTTDPAGLVLEQNPEPGQIVEPGSTISLIVSDGQGKAQTTVPDLLGKTKAQAIKALEAAGLSAGTVSRKYSSDYEKGQVMEQQYGEGTKLDEGSTVNFTVSRGSRNSTVDLYIDFEDAEEEIFYMTVTVTDDDGTRNIISHEKREKSSEGETVKIKGRGTGTITVIFDDKTVMRRNVDFTTGDLT